MSKSFRAILIGLALAIAVGLALFILSGRTGPEVDQGSSVAILNLGPHPLMETITSECQKRLESSVDHSISVKVFDANFQPEVLRASARQMVASSYDVLVAVTTPAAQTLIAESSGQQSIVFTFVSSPEALGLEGASPPWLTGLVDAVPVRENLELIRNLYGEGTKVGYLVNDGEASAAAAFARAEESAPQVGIELRKVPISSEADVRPAAEAVARAVDVLLMGPDTAATSAIDSLVPLSRDQKLPVHCMDPATVERGCLAAIAPDYAGMGAETAEYVIQILDGVVPKDLPIVTYTGKKLYTNEELAGFFSVSPSTAAGALTSE